MRGMTSRGDRTLPSVRDTREALYAARCAIGLQRVERPDLDPARDSGMHGTRRRPHRLAAGRRGGMETARAHAQVRTEDSAGCR